MRERERERERERDSCRQMYARRKESKDGLDDNWRNDISNKGFLEVSAIAFA